MSDFQTAALLLGAGLFFSVHCFQASRKEFLADKAEGGLFGNYDRSLSPVGFWIIMAANLAAALMGLIFLGFGVVGMLVYFEVLK